MSKKQVPKHVVAHLNGVPIKIKLTKYNGGSFERPNGSLHTLMEIGADCSWKHFIGTLTHEAMEAAAYLLDLRFSRDGYANDTSDTFFYWNHEEFTRICNQAGSFMADVIPTLAKMYNAWQAKKNNPSTY